VAPTAGGQIGMLMETFEKQCLFIRVKFRADGHHTPLHVHDGLDEVSELLPSNPPQLVTCDGGTHDLHRHEER
jgi:hypothetical protein